MCFPPFCEPARRFMGCFSLRIGASVVLFLNFLYGFALVVTHANQLGTEAKVDLDTDPTPQGRRLGAPPPPAKPAAPAGPATSWFMQILDLDIGFGHQLLGEDDYFCLVLGLLYGLCILLLSGCMFQQVHSKSPNLPMFSRWFVALMNFEIVMYIGLVLAKSQSVCTMTIKFFPLLKMNCDVLKFLYMKDAVILLTLGGFCTWIFSSLAYFLAFGFDAVETPYVAEHMDIHDAAHEGRGGVMPGLGMYDRARVGTRVQPSRVSSMAMVGPAVTTAGSHRLPSQARIPKAYAGPVSSGYHIPRATSSMASSAPSVRNLAGEAYPLIRGPTAIH
eukprot:TRINITY_DN7097_c0_g1_i5.p1 TRINITY_DN7097_c0_g1~~TRINITY_DN7097_c0_g1_i5.p1  ORF type:complete len:332 (+),score=41.47 TRINITY_DN7097_c0_g1_i5:168-1163(+)